MIIHIVELQFHLDVTSAYFSETAIKLPTKDKINLLLTSLISSGTNQIKAPNFLAIEMANLAFAYFLRHCYRCKPNHNQHNQVLIH